MTIMNQSHYMCLLPTNVHPCDRHGPIADPMNDFEYDYMCLMLVLFLVYAFARLKDKYDIHRNMIVMRRHKVVMRRQKVISDLESEINGGDCQRINADCQGRGVKHIYNHRRKHDTSSRGSIILIPNSVISLVYGYLSEKDFVAFLQCSHRSRIIAYFSQIAQVSRPRYIAEGDDDYHKWLDWMTLFKRFVRLCKHRHCIRHLAISTFGTADSSIVQRVQSLSIWYHSSMSPKCFNEEKEKEMSSVTSRLHENIKCVTLVEFLCLLPLLSSMTSLETLNIRQCLSPVMSVPIPSPFFPASLTNLCISCTDITSWIDYLVPLIRSGNGPHGFKLKCLTLGVLKRRTVYVVLNSLFSAPPPSFPTSVVPISVSESTTSSESVASSASLVTFLSQVTSSSSSSSLSASTPFSPLSSTSSSTPFSPLSSTSSSTPSFPLSSTSYSSTDHYYSNGCCSKLEKLELLLDHYELLLDHYDMIPFTITDPSFRLPSTVCHVIHLPLDIDPIHLKRLPDGIQTVELLNMGVFERTTSSNTLKRWDSTVGFPSLMHSVHLTSFAIRTDMIEQVWESSHIHEPLVLSRIVPDHIQRICLERCTLLYDTFNHLPHLTSLVLVQCSMVVTHDLSSTMNTTTRTTSTISASSLSSSSSSLSSLSSSSSSSISLSSPPRCLPMLHSIDFLPQLRRLKICICTQPLQLYLFRRLSNHPLLHSLTFALTTDADFDMTCGVLHKRSDSAKMDPDWFSRFPQLTSLTLDEYYGTPMKPRVLEQFMRAVQKCSKLQFLTVRRLYEPIRYSHDMEKFRNSIDSIDSLLTTFHSPMKKSRERWIQSILCPLQQLRPRHSISSSLPSCSRTTTLPHVQILLDPATMHGIRPFLIELVSQLRTKGFTVESNKINP